MITEQEYKELKTAQAVYEAWAEKFRSKKSGWICIPADAIPPVKFENDDRAKIEVYEFVTLKPSRYFAYFIAAKYEGNKLVSPAVIQNWTGEVLARVTYSSIPKKSIFGDKRIYFSAKGVNGIRYHGVAYVTAGDYCRMRAYKNQ